jgi:hypothetical protein
MTDGQTYRAYLVTDEQLQALKAARSPQTAEVVTAIEAQHVGALRAAAGAAAGARADQARGAVGEAKTALIERYRAAIEQAIAKVSQEA